MDYPFIPIAHCSREIADWLDPTGTLQRAGLLVVDLPARARGTIQMRREEGQP